LILNRYAAGAAGPDAETAADCPGGIRVGDCDSGD